MKFLLVTLMYIVLFIFVGVGAYLCVLLEKNKQKYEKISDMDIEDVIADAVVGGLTGVAILLVLFLIGFLFFGLATYILG